MVKSEETVLQPVTAVLPAGAQINETKLTHALDAQRLRPAAEDQTAGLWILDDGLDEAAWGAKIDLMTDISAAQDGDSCFTCGQPLRAERAVEVANIFKLGTRYRQTMGATFVDRQGNQRPLVMGSYGIGVTRLLACLAEHHHDRDERPGVKFHDADLIGLPLRLTVSRRSLAEGGVEVKARTSSETAVVRLENLPAHVTNWLGSQE